MSSWYEGCRALITRGVGPIGGNLAIRWILILIAVAATQCWLLAARLPWISSLEGWFEPARPTAMPEIWLAVIPGIVLAGAIYRFVGPDGDETVETRPGRTRSVALAIVAIALCWLTQVSVGLTEGKGARFLSNVMVHSGHFEAASVATLANEHDSLGTAIANYEEMLTRGTIPSYPFNTKPPGFLLSYMVTDRLGDLASPGSDREFDVRFSTYLWPAMVGFAALLLIPLGRSVGLPRAGVFAALLYSVVPSVVLMVMHLDQCLFPVLAVLCVLLFAAALARTSLLLAGLAGVAFYVCMFVTFSLIPLVLLLGLHTVFAGLKSFVERRGTPGTGWRFVLRNPTRLWVSFAVGLLGTHALVLLVWGYDALERGRIALSDHHNFKGVEWTLANTTHYALVNMIEFALWVGLPLTILWLVASTRSLVRISRLREGIEAADAFVLALLLTMFALAFFGKTSAETSRLWMFLMPFVCLVAATEIARFPTVRSRRAVLLVAGLAQFACVLFAKAFNDI